MEPVYLYPGEENPAVYDLENAIADPEQRIERFMESVCPLNGITLTSIGGAGASMPAASPAKPPRYLLPNPRP